jgi:hypothetical protein
MPDMPLCAGCVAREVAELLECSDSLWCCDECYCSLLGAQRYCSSVSLTRYCCWMLTLVLKLDFFRCIEADARKSCAGRVIAAVCMGAQRYCSSVSFTCYCCCVGAQRYCSSVSLTCYCCCVGAQRYCSSVSLTCYCCYVGCKAPFGNPPRCCGANWKWWRIRAHNLKVS